MINSKINNTKKVFKDFAKYSVKRNITMKIIYILAVLILAASVVLFVSNHILDGAIFTVLGVIFALCAPAMEWLNVSNNKSNVNSVDEFQFYEDRFVVTSFDKNGLEISDSTLIYSRLYKVKKYLNYGYIYVNKAVVYIVDKNEFEDEKQFDFVLDRINQAIVGNKKNKGATPVVFGSQNVTAPTEEPPQDLGEPVPPPPTEEDLAYEEEQKENKRITEFEGIQKIDYEGNVEVVALEDKEENEEVSEETNENNEEETEIPTIQEDALKPISDEDDDTDEGNNPAEQVFEYETSDIENQSEEELNKEPIEQNIEEDLIEDTEPAYYENLIPTVKEESVDDDDAPAEQTPNEQVEDLTSQVEEIIAPVEENVVDEEIPTENPEVVAPFMAEQTIQQVQPQLIGESVVEETTPVVQEVQSVEEPLDNAQTPVAEEEYVVEEETPAEDNVKETQTNKKRGRPAGSTKKPKTDDGEDKPKRKRGRPAKSKTEQVDKPKGKRGRPAKQKTAEELNKPKGKRGRPSKKKIEEVDIQPAQDIALSEEKPADTPVVITPVMAEQTIQQVQNQPVKEPVLEQQVQQIEKPVDANQTSFVEETPVVREVQSVNNYLEDDNDDEGDNPAQQQPQDFGALNNVIENQNEVVEEEYSQQVSQSDLDEVAALQAEYNMPEENTTSQYDNQVDGNLLNQEQPFANSVFQETQLEEDFENFEGPADLGSSTQTTFQTPIIEDTEEYNNKYDAQNETNTPNVSDENVVETQKFDNNTYDSDVNNDTDADNIGDIDVNSDDVSIIADNMPEDVEGETTEDNTINEFPSDIDDDTTRNN